MLLYSNAVLYSIMSPVILSYTDMRLGHSEVLAGLPAAFDATSDFGIDRNEFGIAKDVCEIVLMDVTESESAVALASVTEQLR